jgi:hypothetical protein
MPTDRRSPAPSPAGYSGTPLPKKLGLPPGGTLRLHRAPDGFETTLGTLPERARVLRSGGRGDLSLWFVRSRRDLDCGVARRADGIPSRGLWIAWPKKTSGVATDVTESDVRAAGLSHGLVDYKICAVDAVWSGLKFAPRRKAPGRPPHGLPVKATTRGAPVRRTRT